MNWFLDLFYNFKFGARSPDWRSVRKSFAKANPKCAVCGDNDIEIHHKKPYHLFPELELDENNLISLCRRDHFLFGHLCDWKCSNSEVVKDAKDFNYKIKNRK